MMRAFHWTVAATAATGWVATALIPAEDTTIGWAVGFIVGVTSSAGLILIGGALLDRFAAGVETPDERPPEYFDADTGSTFDLD